MKKMSKMGKSILLSSLAIVAFGGIAAGTTYALFTSNAETTVSVSTGKVKVDTKVSDIHLYSLDESTDTTKELAEGATTFTNGGTFAYDENTGAIELDRLTPGDKVEFTITATNSSTVNIKYRTVLKTLDKGLFQGLKVIVNDTEYDGTTAFSNYATLSAETDFTDKEYKFSIELPKDAGDEYQEKSCELNFNVEAVQGNAAVKDTDQTLYEIYTSSDLAAFAKKANANTLTCTKAILMDDIDMSGIKYDSPHFSVESIEFDGNGKTIKNFAPSVHFDGSNPYLGLIGQPAKNTKIYNVNFEAAKVEGTTAFGTEDPDLNAGVVVGYLDNGRVSLEISNVSVKNSSVSKVKYSGGIIGYTSCNDVKLENITVENSSFEGYTVGGLIGQVGGGNTVINNVVGTAVHSKGYKREGGMVGAVTGASLDITYDPTKYSSSISGSAISAKGAVVGLPGTSTKVNGVLLS